MPEEEVKCKIELKDLLDKTKDWMDKQKELTEEAPTPEKVEEITKLYEDIVKKSKEFAKCEVK